ncbi:ParB family transcriptional regulator, chromosome partitioning protein (plasmid) [Pararobbsia alpina]|uniref:PRTRC system ParB family protein n=1 Tax=Pararobbsia alpina TaxID=621374 RepID=UPI0039A42A6A
MSYPSFLPLGRIKQCNNPRKFFDPAAMASLTASVKEHGVMQPLLVRPIEDDFFEIVAGERRFRAARDAHGDDYEIPVLVQEMSALEARAKAIVENIQRDDMAPSEEAISAAELVGNLKGDRDEAARVLGWSRATLDSRLALMNCSTPVLEALNTRGILLGHAELLAALSKENQDKLLPIILTEKKTVPELKRTIESVSCVLAAAIFDKAECAGCQHNSALQSTLFGEAIDAGNCTNRACFNMKAEAHLQTTAAAMKDEYPTIRIVRAGDNNTRVRLRPDGATGVGEEQAKSCHACQNYGAAISGLPDSLGKIYRGQCFDTACNASKVAARIKSERDASQPKARSSADGSAPAKAQGKSFGSSKSAEAPVTPVSETEKVKAFRVALWRKALRREVARDADKARRYLLATILCDYGRKINIDAMKVVWQKLTDEKAAFSDMGRAAMAVEALADDVQGSLLIGATVAAIEGIEVNNLVQLCKHHKLDLGLHFQLSKEFLELLTKSEMMVVADEIGLRAALADEFKKTFNKPKGEVIDALLSVRGFDYAGKVPKVLKY